jgi:hypothetical protein
LAAHSSAAAQSEQSLAPIGTAPQQEDATTIIDSFLAGPTLESMCPWIESSLRANVGEGFAPLEAKAPGVTDHALATAMPAAMAHCDQELEAVRQSLSAFLASRYDAEVLRRLATYFKSPSGQRYVALVKREAVPAVGKDGVIPPAVADRMIDSLSARDREALEQVQNSTPSFSTVVKAMADESTELIAQLLMRKWGALSEPLLAAAKDFMSHQPPTRR